MKRILTISKYTFIDLFKSRITLNVFILGLILCVVSYISYSFTFGVPQKVALDVGLGLLSISSVAVALFLGSNLISQEIESRTVYVVLSRSISRLQFLAGKLLGLIFILCLNISILTSFIFGLYLFLGGEFQGLFLWSVLFTMIEALLVMMIAVFFSLISNKVMTILVTISLYVVGHALNPANIEAFLQRSPLLSTIVDGFNWLLPNFYKLNLKDLVLYQQTVESHYLYITLAYGLGYTLFLAIISLTIFNRKNLN